MPRIADNDTKEIYSVLKKTLISGATECCEWIDKNLRYCVMNGE